MSRARPVDEATVRERLDRVTDPELDRSIVDLDYVEEMVVEDGTVRIRLRLPTAWCSPAFAWMMATDAKEGVEALPGVRKTEVRLRDYMHAEEIHRGLAEGLAFESVFEDATEGVDSVRATLDAKARLARQYEAVEALREAGVRPAQLRTLRRGDVTLRDDGVADVELADGALFVSTAAEPVASYLEKATAVGVATAADDPLFATPEGDPIPPGEFEVTHRRARLAKTNLDGQGGLCAGLHRARNGESTTT